MMAPLMIGLVVLLVLLLLVGVLATGSVVARLAVHMRDDSWSRITAQYGFLRRKESALLVAVEKGTCVACGGPHGSVDRHWDERGN